MLDQLRQIIAGEKQPSLSLARRLATEYPACILPAALALNASHNDRSPAAEELTAFLAARLSDADAIERFLGADFGADGNFYPDSRSETHSTDDTIDSFIGKFSKSDPATETMLLERQIFGDSVDYAASFLSDNPDSPAAQTEASRENQPAPGPEALPADKPSPAMNPSPETPKTGKLSLSLAQVMIKNHNYTKALEIIQAISLTNPEKSIYFADQIRFLKKLIINDNKS